MEVLRQKLSQLQLFRQDYVDIKTLLKTFPEEKTRTAMVPYGNVAFLDGQFENTDEIYVSLGAEYFAKYSASEASAVAERRLKMVETLVKQVEEELEVHELTEKFADLAQEASTMEGQDWDADQTAVDIREEWTEEDEHTFSSRNKAHVSAPVAKQTIKSPVKSDPKPVVAKSSPISAVKERIVERKPKKQTITDPISTSLHNHAKESLFRRALRRETADPKDSADETMSPR